MIVEKTIVDIKTGPPSPSSPSNNNSTLVNTLNCVNTTNIKINTETNKSSTSGLQPIQDSDAQGLDGNLDGLLNQIDSNKTIINLCFINDNDNIV